MSQSPNRGMGNTARAKPRLTPRRTAVRRAVTYGTGRPRIDVDIRNDNHLSFVPTIFGHFWQRGLAINHRNASTNIRYQLACQVESYRRNPLFTALKNPVPRVTTDRVSLSKTRCLALSAPSPGARSPPRRPAPRRSRLRPLMPPWPSAPWPRDPPPPR